MIPFPEEAALAVASSVTPTALAAAASPSRLAASMSLTSAPPPSPEVARSRGSPPAAAFASRAPTSSPIRRRRPSPRRRPPPSTFARGAGWRDDAANDGRRAAGAGATRTPRSRASTVPTGRSALHLHHVGDDLGRRAAGLWGGAGAGSSGAAASSGGGDRSCRRVRDETDELRGSSSSESSCGGRRRDASGDGDLARGGDGSRRGGEGSRAREVPARRGFLPGSARRRLCRRPRMSPREGPSHGVRGVPADAARASCWRNAFVCSGSSPATIFSGLARTCSPSASPTHAMILVSHATLLALSLTFPESLSTSSNRPRANPVFRVTSDTTSWRNLNGGFFRRFSVSCGGGRDRVWVGVSGRGGQRRSRIFEKATRDGSRSAVGRGRALAFGLRTIGSEPCRSSCVTVQYSAMAPTPSPRTRPSAFELCAPPSRKRLSFSGADMTPLECW